MKAIILSAGQGKRLLPYTADRPKCLLQISQRSVLDWQVRALAACGVTDVVVVTGFASDAVDAAAKSLSAPTVHVRTLFNPFYRVADNIGSCHVARHEMESDFILLNGDTLVEPDIIATLLDTARAPVTVTVDRKPSYDDDDMKVSLDGQRLTAIGKTLPLECVDAESIGLLLFRGDGARAFTRDMEALLREPRGLKCYYLSVIDRLARAQEVGTVDIAGGLWAEIDYPKDLEKAEQLAAVWSSQRWAEPERPLRNII